ncbi:hypothetical protein ABHP49_005400 [Bacillus cereus]
MMSEKVFVIEIAGDVKRSDINDALYHGLERNEVEWTSYNVKEINVVEDDE